VGEGSDAGPLGLLGEVHASEVEVLLRHPEVRVPCPLHDREPGVTGCGVVRDRGVSTVVERSHVVRDLGLEERRTERLRVALVIEDGALLGMAEHALVVTLVPAPAPVIEDLPREELVEDERPSRGYAVGARQERPRKSSSWFRLSARRPLAFGDTSAGRQLPWRDDDLLEATAWMLVTLSGVLSARVA
jgi:hypothetical protein